VRVGERLRALQGQLDLRVPGPAATVNGLRASVQACPNLGDDIGVWAGVEKNAADGDGVEICGGACDSDFGGDLAFKEAGVQPQSVAHPDAAIGGGDGAASGTGRRG
jgi:hypothetical protein